MGQTKSKCYENILMVDDKTTIDDIYKYLNDTHHGKHSCRAFRRNAAGVIRLQELTLAQSYSRYTLTNVTIRSAALRRNNSWYITGVDHGGNRIKVTRSVTPDYDSITRKLKDKIVFNIIGSRAGKSVDMFQIIEDPANVPFGCYQLNYDDPDKLLPEEGDKCIIASYEVLNSKRFDSVLDFIKTTQLTKNVSIKLSVSNKPEVTYGVTKMRVKNDETVALDLLNIKEENPWHTFNLEISLRDLTKPITKGGDDMENFKFMTKTANQKDLEEITMSSPPVFKCEKTRDMRYVPTIRGGGKRKPKSKKKSKLKSKKKSKPKSKKKSAKPRRNT